MSEILTIVSSKLELFPNLPQKNDCSNEIPIWNGLSGETLSTASIAEVAKLLCQLPKESLIAAGIIPLNECKGKEESALNLPPLLSAMVSHYVMNASLTKVMFQFNLSLSDKARLLKFSFIG